MKNNTVIDLDNPVEFNALTELLRSSAKRLNAEAIQAELDEQLVKFEDQITADGRQRAVRSGYHPEREIVTGVGKVSVTVPKIQCRAGEPESFQSLVVPPYIRRTATLNAASP